MLLPLAAFAQTNDYNKWSIELDAGGSKPYRTFSNEHTPGEIEFITANLGARYMFNTKFGLKTDIGYSTWDSDTFDTEYYRGSLQAVFNIANIVDTKSTFFKNFGLLLHAGAGLSVLNYEEPRDDFEWTAHGIVGLTPQIKLSNRVSLQADLSLISNILQDSTFDGTQSISGDRFLDGSILTATIGLAINLGKHATHADWTNANPWTKEIEELKSKIAKIETDMIDTDQDGVPDYLDREPNTASGASVNTKGITMDLNQNGIPDEFETSLDRKYLKEDPKPSISYEDVIKKLISEGYVNVYFATNSSTPSKHSVDAINFLIEYMNTNPTAKAEVIGYADQRGSEAYNTTLSAKRAQKVTDILVASGIDAARLTNTGSGESTSSDSNVPLQLQRRVTFKLK